jgi:DUF4097 and DUF4098 domain-containing protein YvlB
MKAQARAMRDQAKAQQRQFRLQRRALRRPSILGPLLLLGLGVAFLVAHVRRIPWGQSLEWYSQWWPAVLILAGLVLIAEWAFDQRRAQTDGHVRAVGGGVVLILILLTLTGLGARGFEYGRDWHERAFGSDYAQLSHLFGDKHDGESTVSSSIAPGATLVVHNPHGSVTVSGASEDGEVHVSVHTESYAWKEDDADAKARRLEPVFRSTGKDLALDVASVEGGQADLTIELPRTNAVTLQANNGDVTINDMASALVLSANHGDVEISGVNGPVNLHVHDDDANLTLHSITGPVLIDGRGGDTEVADIQGDVTLQGDFFGSTHLQHITGAVRFESSRTRFSAARLDDEFSINSGELDATSLVGPVVLKTADKKINLDRVQGSIEIVNRNGSIAVTQTPALATVSIENKHGSVDLGLAGGSGFLLHAVTRNGDMENDFGLTTQGSESNRVLAGPVAGGGPAVNVTTSDGDVTIRRSSVAPLPPVPPAPPITLAPLALPAPPKAPAAPRAPKAPKPPPVTGQRF